MLRRYLLAVFVHSRAGYAAVAVAVAIDHILVALEASVRRISRQLHVLVLDHVLAAV